MADKNKTAEAATIKARVARMIRDARALLDAKTLPADMATALENVRTGLRKTWADLDTESRLETGRRGLSTESAGVDELGESYDDAVYIPWGVYSFDALEKVEQTNEVAETIREKTGQFVGIVQNIMFAPAEVVPDKLSALTALFDEFTLIVSDAIGNPPMGETATPPAAEPTPEPTPPAAEPAQTAETETFAESFDSAVAIISDELSEAESSPLEMDVQIISPGWGNTRDNHYYPAEMLRKNAEKFIGAKMYESDHKPNEKSTRTWVSTVKEITGFTDAGAPIGRVVVHDPNFAERLRNLNRAGMLEKMECSILAGGTTRAGFELGGRRGKVVESIEVVESVDWVTRAGAGGRAVSIAESADGTGENPVEPEPETEPVTETAPAEETPTPDPVVPVTETAPAALSLAEIAPFIADLPRPVAARISGSTFANVDELKTAIAREIAYIKEITGSGSVSHLGNAAPVRNEVKPSVVAETITAVNRKYLFGG